MKYIFETNINELGQIQKGVNKAIRDVFKFFAKKRVVIKIEKAKKRRSLQQNAYYWAVPVKMIYDKLREAKPRQYEELLPEHVHEFLKVNFLDDKEKIDIEGTEINKNLTTTELTTTEFMAYLADIQRWAIETLQLNIPDPNQEDFLED